MCVVVLFLISRRSSSYVSERTTVHRPRPWARLSPLLALAAKEEALKKCSESFKTSNGKFRSPETGMAQEEEEEQGEAKTTRLKT